MLTYSWHLADLSYNLQLQVTSCSNIICSLACDIIDILYKNKYNKKYFHVQITYWYSSVPRARSLYSNWYRLKIDFKINVVEKS